MQQHSPRVPSIGGSQPVNGKAGISSRNLLLNKNARAGLGQSSAVAVVHQLHTKVELLQRSSKASNKDQSPSRNRNR